MQRYVCPLLSEICLCPCPSSHTGLCLPCLGDGTLHPFTYCTRGRGGADKYRARFARCFGKDVHGSPLLCLLYRPMPESFDLLCVCARRS